MGKWQDDLDLSKKAQPFQDIIYQDVFNTKKINRYANEDKHILDVKFHIDVELELNNNIKLLGQEKALRYEFSRFNTFTIEFYQNRFTKEQGEFFNLGAQFYLHSYFNKDENGFEKWYLIKIFDFLSWLKDTNISELERHTKPSTSRASFYYIDYEDIPQEFIYDKCSTVKQSMYLF